MKSQATTLVISIIIIVTMSVAATTISFAVQGAAAQPMSTDNTDTATTTTNITAFSVPAQGNTTTVQGCPVIVGVLQDAVSEFMVETETGAVSTCETYCCAMCTVCVESRGERGCQECENSCHGRGLERFQVIN